MNEPAHTTRNPEESKSDSHSLSRNLETIRSRYRCDPEWEPYPTCYSGGHTSAYVEATHRLTWLDYRGRTYVMELCLACAGATMREGHIQVIDVSRMDDPPAAATGPTQTTLDGV